MRRLAAVAVPVALGVALPLLAIEVALRVRYPQPHVLARHDALGALPRPHMDVRKAYGGHERVVRITTNRLGLRAPELEELRAAPHRVVALGDSFTFGDAVEADEAWPRQLERALNGGRAEAAYRVVNAGVSGYGTGQALLLYRMLEETVRPEVVVLGFSIVNDLLDNLCVSEATYATRQDVPCFRLSGRELRLTPPRPPADDGPSRAAGWRPRSEQFLRGQLKRLTVWNPAVVRAARSVGLPIRLPYRPATVESWYNGQYADAGWRLTRRLLLELRDETARRRQGLVVLLVPAGLQVQPALQEILSELAGDHEPTRRFLAEPLRPQRLILAFCAENELECVDPTSALRASAEPTYYPVDSHWTPAAHRIAAELTAGRVRDARRGAASRLTRRRTWPKAQIT